MENSGKNSEDVRISNLAIDSFERAIKSRNLSDTDLRNVISAAKCNRVGPREIGKELLLALYERFPVIETVWHDFVNSNRAHVRLVAISAVWDERIPFQLAKELTEEALNDKSSKVRLFAADRIFVRNIEGLIPVLKKREKVEMDKEILRYIQWALEHMEQTERLAGFITSSPRRHHDHRSPFSFSFVTLV